MMKSPFQRALVSVLLIVVLFHTASLACGPFTVSSIFVFTVHPAFPLSEYASGRIGVVQPSYARSYLYVAYRHLSAAPFTEAEVKELTDVWNQRLGLGGGGDDDGVQSWLEARKKISGLAEIKSIEVYRAREKPNEYDYFINCQNDAFQAATRTLEDRAKKYGADSPTLRSWVEAQDQVFTNCGKGQTIPTQLPADADAVAKADRNYQIAAANFYSGNFDAAAKSFESIAADKSSPWQPLATYLLARTWIRKASLGPAETKNESLISAETQLKKVVSDDPVHRPSATGLLNLVNLRLRPAQRLHELANKLSNKATNYQIKQDLWDYTILLDQALEVEDAAKATIPKEELTKDDLTDWITTFERNTPDSRQRALDRYRQTKSDAWLVAALVKTNGKDAEAETLISDALKVRVGSAAYASSRYHAVRLMIESGKTDQARTFLDQLLKQGSPEFDASTVNLLLSERMMIATNLSDFLKHSFRKPAALSWNDDGREIPTEPSELSDESKSAANKDLFSFDSTKVLNFRLPLSLLKEAAKDTSLPSHLRTDIAQATWIRAAILGDNRTADELVPVLKDLVPSLSPHLDEFLRTTQPEAKKFIAIYTWLKFPGIEPVVDYGIGRSTALGEQDTYRDNWWCTATTGSNDAPEDESETQSFTMSTLSAPLFLADAQKAAAAKESTSLNSLGGGATPNYLVRQVVSWANRTPADPRVPEALHLAVTSTRFGCTDKETGRWSKTAFDLLHRKYPTSPWAKKTKYWFKE